MDLLCIDHIFYVYYCYLITFLSQFQMRDSKLCNVTCKIDKLSAEDATKFKEKIEDEYRVNM